MVLGGWVGLEDVFIKFGQTRVSNNGDGNIADIEFVWWWWWVGIREVLSKKKIPQKLRPPKY